MPYLLVHPQDMLDKEVLTCEFIVVLLTLVICLAHTALLPRVIIQ